MHNILSRVNSGKNAGCSAEGLGSKPGWGSQEFSKFTFISRNSAACNVALAGALYSVLYTEASKAPGTSLSKWDICELPSLIISSSRLLLAASHKLTHLLIRTIHVCTMTIFLLHIPTKT